MLDLTRVTGKKRQEALLSTLGLCHSMFIHNMTFEARTIDHVNFVQIHSVHHLQRELLAGSRFGLQYRYFKMQQVCVFLMFFDIFSSTLDPFFSPASLRFCSSPSGH